MMFSKESPKQSLYKLTEQTERDVGQNDEVCQNERWRDRGRSMTGSESNQIFFIKRGRDAERKHYMSMSTRQEEKEIERERERQTAID